MASAAVAAYDRALAAVTARAPGREDSIFGRLCPVRERLGQIQSVEWPVRCMRDAAEGKCGRQPVDSADRLVVFNALGQPARCAQDAGHPNATFVEVALAPGILPSG